MKSRQFRLRQRPTGLARSTDFDLAEDPVPVPGFGEALVKPRSQSKPTLKSSRWRCSAWKFSASPGAHRTLTERARSRDQ